MLQADININTFNYRSSKQMSIRISSINANMPVYMLNSKNITKKIKLPAAENGMAALSASALAMILPANSFLEKTNQEPLKMMEYVNRNGHWYKVHYPMDGSDYYYEFPCGNPYDDGYKYSGS